MEQQLNAFVIMPFDHEFDEVYAELIARPLEAVGYRVQRADDVESRQNVLADVVRGIAAADLVVADVTTANPNVFYELGLAHAMGIPTVLIAQQESADEIPFDLRQYRTEFYDTHFHRAKAISDSLASLGESHAAGRSSFGSPISDFLPGASLPASRAERTGAVGNGGMNAGADHHDEAPKIPPTEDDDLGLVDFVEAFGDASNEFEIVLESINSATEDVGSDLSLRAQDMDELDQASPGYDGQAKRLLLRVAHRLDAYADNIEASQDDLERAVDNVTSNGLGYLTLLAENPRQFPADLVTARDTARGLLEAVTDAGIGLAELRDAVASLPPILKQTNRARNRCVRALGLVLSQQERVKSYAEQSVQMTEAALASLASLDAVPKAS